MRIEGSAAGRWLRRGLAALLLAGTAAAGAQSIESVLQPGPVIQGHAKTENDCSACHQRFDRNAQDGLCIACHKEVGADIRQHTGFHGRREVQRACRSCHTEHKGRGAVVVLLDQKNFDHRQSDFELLDKHAGVDCAKCHLPGKKWREAPLLCNACHQKDDKHKGGLGTKCEECHSAKTWKVSDFDHGKKTRFALSGKHADAKCDDCHANARYKDTPRTCIGCHRKDDDDKGHKGQYGEKCESCHGAKAWKPANFNHDVDTRYPLKDKHRPVKCASCHTTPLYAKKTGTQCIDCHAKDDKHKETLGRKCGDCHTERGWKEPPGFDHDKSRFPLHGAHIKTACKDCHQDQLYRRTPSDCFSCHKKDDRHQGNLGTKCADCHKEDVWKLPLYDHEKTKFPLRNAHAARSVKCSDCHETLRQMRGIATTCISCHKRDDRHEGTLGERCDSCHRDVNWRVERFDHARTRYPLAGRHLVVACASCHKSLKYREAPRDCIGCHEKDDQRRHKATLGSACETCHNVRAWTLWDFDHQRDTRWRLEGRHVKVRCEDCHTKPAPAGKKAAPVGTDCMACHRKDDTHEGRFGRRCEQCHSSDAWKPLKPGASTR